MNENINNDDLSKDFQRFYRKELKVFISDIEQEKKEAFGNIIYFLFISVVFSFFLLTFHNTVCLVLSCFIYIFAFYFIFMAVKHYKMNAKKNILPKLLSFVGEFKVEDKKDNYQYIKKLNLFPNFDLITYDDRIKGKYKLLNIDISELQLLYGYGKNQKTVFAGILITVPCNKRFLGVTTIRNKSIYSDNLLYKEFYLNNSNSNKQKLETVHLEDVKFNELYTVQSTDQVEARYLLTASFMNRLVKQTIPTSVSFEYGNVHIALHTPNKDWFELPILKRADDINNYKAIIYEIIQIMRLLDSLKLEQKIGL